MDLDGFTEGADDVFVQIGQYELGNNIDEFVWGPLLVAYRDGSAFAEVDDSVVGVAERSPIEALLDPAQIDSIRQAADALPDDAEIGLDQRPEDGIPRMLIVDDQTWLIHDLSAEPFRSFMESVTEAVEATEVDQWTPQRWVERGLVHRSVLATGSFRRVRRTTTPRCTPTSLTNTPSATSTARA